MDSQFNSLVRSYSDNYIQFKVTGNPRYQQSYSSAEEGIQNIISQLQTQVDIQKDQMAAFYKSGVEQKITELDQRNKVLQRGLLDQKDEATAAQMRATSTSPSFSIPTWQYVTLGVLGATAIGLSVL